MQSSVWPTVLVGDVREMLKTLPNESVHCCVTSPPYWGLRDYGVPGQIGLEPTPEGHVAVLVDVFSEVKRVLRRDGTLWLNYGDCYACAPNGRKAADITADDRAFRDKPFSTVTSNAAHRCPEHRQNDGFRSGKHAGQKGVAAPIGLKPKDLVGMSWRVAFALQADGWWLRSAITICKNNPMPESVQDRPTQATEMLFLLTKAPSYFYDADAIRESHQEPWRSTGRLENRGCKDVEAGQNGGFGLDGVRPREYNPAGRNKRNWWVINSQPLSMAHFATFPEALVEPCILAGTSERGCCPECGAPWARVVEKEVSTSGSGRAHIAGGDRTIGRGWEGTPRGSLNVTTTGWRSTCAHPHTEAETVPAVVLDPFAGSGTTLRVASRLGRRSIGIELNEAYIEILKKRTAQGGLGL